MSAAARLPRDGEWRQPVANGWLSGRRLGRSDLGELIAFHRQILSGLEPWRLNAETDAFFEAHLSAAGCILGLFEPAGALVAYAVLGLPDADSDYNFGHSLGLAGDELAKVAHLDGAAVAPAWRGHSLQRELLRRRIDMAKAARRRWLITTVAPLNVVSLRSCLSVGLIVRVCRPMFASGHVRLLLALDVAGDPPLDRSAAYAVALSEPDRIAEALAGGAIGFALSGDEDVPALLMAPMVREAR